MSCIDFTRKPEFPENASQDGGTGLLSFRTDQFLNWQRACLAAALPVVTLVIVEHVPAQDAGYNPIPAVRPVVPQPLVPQPVPPQTVPPQTMIAPGMVAPPAMAPAGAGLPGSTGMFHPPVATPTEMLPVQPQVPQGAGLTVRQGILSPATNRDGISPPPGTLGTTYQRRSRLVPDDKHPRTAIVDLWNVPESADINARGLKPRWYQDHWRLESETPLIPGIPHIYGIQVTKTIDGQKTVDVKWVRLIMGRIVDLDF